MEKLPIAIEKYSYAKLISELLLNCKKYQINYEIIGYKKSKITGIDYPLYKVVVNPQAKNKFCIMAGVHSCEIAGPLTMLYLLNDPKKYFNSKIAYHIYPVISPFSFDLRQRFNEEGEELNTVDLTNLNVEVKYFFNNIEGINFNVFLSLHEDIDRNDFYAYIFENNLEPVYRKVIKNTSKYCKIWKDKTIYGDATDQNGLIINKYDQSFEDKLFQDKRAKFSLCTETPGKLNIGTRIRINLDNINILSNYVVKK